MMEDDTQSIVDVHASLFDAPACKCLCSFDEDRIVEHDKRLERGIRSLTFNRAEFAGRCIKRGEGRVMPGSSPIRIETSSMEVIACTDRLDVVVECLGKHSFRQVGRYGRPTDPIELQKPRGQECLVSHLLSPVAQPWSMAQEPVVRINGPSFRGTVRRLPVGCAHDEESQEFLLRPTKFTLPLEGKPVQEPRV